MAPASLHGHAATNDPGRVVSVNDFGGAGVSGGHWCSARLDLLDHLFGRGFMLPGGATELLKLVRPLNLTLKSTMLVVGAGVDGPVRSIEASVGCTVQGFEAVPDLIRHATAAPLDAASHAVRSASSKPSEPLRPWNPQEPDFGRAAFTRAMAITPLSLGPAEPLLAAIGNALRPNGQLMLIDLVTDTPAAGRDPDLARFFALEHIERVRESIEVGRILGRLGYTLRATEDLSSTYTRLAVMDWRRMLNGMPKSQYTVEPALLVEEAERWTVRGQLLSSGRLRLMRWHAVLRGRLTEPAALDSATAPA